MTENCRKVQGRKLKKRNYRLWLSLSLLLLSNTLHLLPVQAEVDPDKDNRAAVKDTDKSLKTKVPSPDERKPPHYVLELKATQTVKPLSSHPVEPVEIPTERISDEADQSASDTTSVTLTRPPLQALIRVQENLNPFSLDARYTETINLEDALNTALDQNLDIQNNYSAMEARKYTYLSAASKFLPDLNAGYSLYGISGSIPGVLFGTTGTMTSAAVPTTGPLALPSSVQLLNAGFTYKAYQGGKVLFGTLEQKQRLRAARAQLKGNINDTLLSAAQRYYDLLLNEALLEIRIRAVAISQEQLRLNTAQEKAGTATGLDVLQSQAQLASDEQNLVDQQNTRRQSALQLADLLNTSFAQDLTPVERHLQKKRLVPQNTPIEELLKIAIDKRPELKQYEALRLAAKRAIVTAAAPLQPTVSLSGSVYGIGVGGSGTGLNTIYDLNFGVKWLLGSMGTTDLANIQQARWQARQAAVQAKETFLEVFRQVRSSYDTSLTSDKRIDRAIIQIRAAEEELRIAAKRMSSGIGLNIDVLNAQRDLTQARINKARAVIDFNVAQSQLLRDTGMISVDTLVNGAKIQ
jgi:outer membrane protein TolC